MESGSVILSLAPRGRNKGGNFATLGETWKTRPRNVEEAAGIPLNLITKLGGLSALTHAALSYDLIRIVKAGKGWEGTCAGNLRGGGEMNRRLTSNKKGQRVLGSALPWVGGQEYEKQDHPKTFSIGNRETKGSRWGACCRRNV